MDIYKLMDIYKWMNWVIEVRGKQPRVLWGGLREEEKQRRLVMGTLYVIW